MGGLVDDGIMQTICIKSAMKRQRTNQPFQSPAVYR